VQLNLSNSKLVGNSSVIGVSIKSMIAFACAIEIAEVICFLAIISCVLSILLIFYDIHRN